MSQPIIDPEEVIVSNTDKISSNTEDNNLLTNVIVPNQYVSVDNTTNNESVSPTLEENTTCMDNDGTIVKTNTIINNCRYDRK